MDIVDLVELARVDRSLRVVLRIAFVGVVLAALVVDTWVVGDRMLRDSLELQRNLLAIVAIACIGIAWALWPRHALVHAIAAAALSLLQTKAGSRNGLQVGVFTEFVVLPVLLAAVLSRKGWARWPIAALVLIAGEAVSWRVEAGPIRAVIAMSMLVLFGTAIAAVVYVRLRDSERHTSIEKARQDERLDLARELHDIVGHHVTGIVVLAQASRFTNGAAPDSPTGRALADIEAAGLETLTSVRRLIGLLRTDPTTSAGPRLADIEQIVEGLRSTHPSSDLVVDDAIRTNWIPPDLANTVQRLVQEAATNIRRHGDPSSPATFELRHTATGFELTVTNRMAHSTVGTGYGLVGMRERVDALGGTFRAGATGDDQWLVRAELPITVGAR